MVFPFATDRARRFAARRYRRFVPGILVSLCVAVLQVSDGQTQEAQEARVFANADSVEPLPVGSPIPSANVRTIDGESVDLATRLGEGGALLVFYRGGW